LQNIDRSMEGERKENMGEKMVSLTMVSLTNEMDA
jgi:hypothetical protein